MSLSVEEAKKVLEEEKEKKSKEFIREYEELCVKYAMRIIPVVSLQVEEVNVQNNVS